MENYVCSIMMAYIEMSFCVYVQAMMTCYPAHNCYDESARIFS